MYEKELEAFVRTAAGICGSREAGRDAVQEAVVSAVRSRDRYRGEGTVEAWLWSAVVRSALKQRSRTERVDVLADVPQAAQSAPASLPPTDVRAAVAALPERQRLVLFLRYYGDLDYRQIASVLGIETGTVGAALHAAHTTLRTMLQEAEDARCL